MRVLIDLHHAGLAESLHLLFEDRLGHEVYVPHGLDWWNEGYWQFGRWAWGDDRLARQFLEIGESHPQYPERKYRRVALSEARDLGDWAYVVASVPDNEQGYHRFAKEQGAKYVLSVGNTSQPVDWSLDPLALVSSEMPIVGRGVRVHQEMSAAFRWREPYQPGLWAASFVNCFPSMPCHTLWRDAYTLAPEGLWGEYGIDGAGGVIEPASKVASRMAVASFGWHDKVHGDGFGHVIHGWAAIGRPLIGHASHYAGKMAGPLWVDGETCIDLDRHSVFEAVTLMREIASDPERHERMCRAMRGRFEALVDYDAEEQLIRGLLE